jgi:hypothetical protein
LKGLLRPLATPAGCTTLLQQNAMVEFAFIGGNSTAC